MHRILSLVTRRRNAVDERGAVAVMIAVTLVLLMLPACAMAVDLGLIRVDRQVNKSAADAAAVAGVNTLTTVDSDSDPHPFRGVCTAIQYLQKNDPRFAGVTDTAGTWSDAATPAAGKANGCTDTTLRNQICSANPTSWAKFTWNGTYDGQPLQVVIQSGYLLNTAPSSWQEETLPAVQADNVDEADGCDQLAVTITQSRKPGLGAVVHPGNVVSTIRSVARVRSAPGKDAPAMLLLRRTGCSALEVGSTSVDNSTVRVLGAVSTNGRTQPGTIHADTDGKTAGSACTAPFYGKALNGIIAYAAPLSLANPTAPDPAKPGRITTVAGRSGLTGVDNANNVYGSRDVGGTSGVKVPVGARGLVTRKPIDDRYLSGVKSSLSGAQGVFATLTSAAVATLPTNGYQVLTCTSAGSIITPSTLPVPTSKVYVDCNDVKSSSFTINAGTVFFRGTVSPTGNVQMPYAHHVYVKGSSSTAVSIGNSGVFSVNTTGNLNTTVTPSKCADAPNALSKKSAVFVYGGSLSVSNGGSLQLCDTTVYMMSGQNDGCVPAPYTSVATAPAPGMSCTGTTAGNGVVGTSGGNVDWTAPNKWDEMTTTDGAPIAPQSLDWSASDGQEDLALWDETYGSGSGNDYKFVGGGAFHVQGVFMVPNAGMQLSGSAIFDLKNAQFVAASLALASANTKLIMSVDPNSAVTLPKLKTVGLVR